MNWPATNKPYLICSEDGKVNKANRKSLFRNKLLFLSYVAPIRSPPTCITTSIVVAMRFVRIKIKDANPPLFLTWARKLFVYIERLPGSTIHIVFDNYNCEDDIFLNPSKGRLTKRSICSLNQTKNSL